MSRESKKRAQTRLARAVISRGTAARTSPPSVQELLKRSVKMRVRTPMSIIMVVKPLSICQDMYLANCLSARRTLRPDQGFRGMTSGWFRFRS